jgi:redox-sensitive bicupin YhaK (pirin superfamily)
MITHIPFNTLGTADYGWLKPRYHFSFSNYYNPERVGFGALLVINDDTIAGNTGFPTHGHDNMEIITYVKSGAITHKDSLGNQGVTGAGDVQVMSAGTGVKHSEYNLEAGETTLYQIWIVPNKKNVAPRWEAAAFPKAVIHEGGLPLLVSGRTEDEGKGALFIHQDAAISGGVIAQGVSVSQPVKYQAYVLASKGACEINGVTLSQGDGAQIMDEKLLNIKAIGGEAEVLVIDVPV